MKKAQEKIPTKARLKDFETLKSRFEKFCEMETVEKIETDLIPKLNDLNDQLETYKKSHQSMKEVI
jgi:hypothetical protein